MPVPSPACEGPSVTADVPSAARRTVVGAMYSVSRASPPTSFPAAPRPPIQPSYSLRYAAPSARIRRRDSSVSKITSAYFMPVPRGCHESDCRRRDARPHRRRDRVTLMGWDFTRLGAGRGDPLDELDDHAVGVGDLEEAFAPGFLAQRHRDVDTFGTQPLLLGLDAGGGESEDQTVGVPVAPFGREEFGAAGIPRPGPPGRLRRLARAHRDHPPSRRIPPHCTAPRLS